MVERVSWPFVASEGATRGSNRCGKGEASFHCHFNAEAAPLGASPVLFFLELPPHVFTIFKGLGRDQKQETNKEKDERKTVDFLV